MCKELPVSSGKTDPGAPSADPTLCTHPTRQQDTPVVHLQAVQEALGEDSSPRPGTDDGRSTGQRLGDVRQIRRQSLPPSAGVSHVLPVDSDDRGDTGQFRTIDSSGSLPGAERDESGLRDDSSAAKPGRRVVNRIFHGAALASLFVASTFGSTIGYAAHAISVNEPYQSLEGPVFGTRVGVYHTDSLPLAHSCRKGLCDGTKDSQPISVYPVSQCTPISNSSGGHLETSESQNNFRATLYKLPCGAIEQGETDDSGNVSTVPKHVKTRLSEVLSEKLRGQIHNLPELGSIPEESEAPDETGDAPAVDVNLLPTDRIELDPGAEHFLCASDAGLPSRLHI